MDIETLSIRDRGGGGKALFDKDEYIATYMSSYECLFDLAYHYTVIPIEKICEAFVCQTFTNEKTDINNRALDKIFKYRGVCSDLFLPTDTVSRYVCYRNTLSEILEEFEKHENRALHYPNNFLYGVQGTGIHIFNKEKNKYDFWLGGNDIKTIQDIIIQAKREHKFIPNEILLELSDINKIDVFISHNSRDALFAKEIYDLLTLKGYKVFLSEISLPAISGADYAYEIDKALENSKNLIVVASSEENIMSSWVRYEYQSFANELRAERKTGCLCTIIDDSMNPSELPYLLRQFEVIQRQQKDAILNYIL